MRSETAKQVLYPGLLLALQLIFIFYYRNAPMGDFGNYYFGSSMLLNGSYSFNNVYDPWQFNMAVYLQGYRNFFLSYTQVPPFSLVFYLPFAALPLYYAKLAWNILSAFFFILILFRVHKQFGIAWIYLLLLPAIFFQPFLANIQQAQSYLIIVYLLLEGFIAWEQKRNWLAAICWAIAIMLKILPAIVLLFLLFNRDYKNIFRCVSVCITLSILSVIITCLLSNAGAGVETWWHYCRHILPRLAAGEINNTYATAYQSMQVLLRNLFVPDAMHNNGALWDQPQLYTALNILFKCVVLCCCAGVAINKNNPAFVSYGTWIIGGLLITGYGTTYGLLMLLLPYVALLSHHRNNNVLIMLSLVLLLVCNMPTHLFGQLHLLFRYLRLWLLLAFTFGWFVCYRPRFNLLLLLIFVPALLFTKSPLKGNPYFLAREEAMLIHSFRFRNDSLQLDYFSQAGPATKAIYTGKINSVADYNYKDQTDWYAMQRRDNKVADLRESVIVNDTMVVYLSDSNRGPGFYTLRYFILQQ